VRKPTATYLSRAGPSALKRDDGYVRNSSRHGNFRQGREDPRTYHLYYGDRVGNPGTILTFFPWEHAAPGRGGVGPAQQTTFRIPLGSIGYWTHRFIEKGVAHEALEKRFGEPVLSFTDPDGLSGSRIRDRAEQRQYSCGTRDPRLSWCHINAR
jgi:catechol 2,3-dioxygenase-like lactoylglutathione lyase family enzyme